MPWATSPYLISRYACRSREFKRQDCLSLVVRDSVYSMRGFSDTAWPGGGDGGRLRLILLLYAVTVEMHHTGSVPALRAEVVAVIEHALGDRPGDWRVLIVGSQANDRWEMNIPGPNAFERSYTLEGAAGEHRPEVIRMLITKMVPTTNS